MREGIFVFSRGQYSVSLLFLGVAKPDAEKFGSGVSSLYKEKSTCMILIFDNFSGGRNLDCVFFDIAMR